MPPAGANSIAPGHVFVVSLELSRCARIPAILKKQKITKVAAEGRCESLK